MRIYRKYSKQILNKLKKAVNRPEVIKKTSKTWFKKGYIPYNKGIAMKEKQKRKIRNTLLGYKHKKSKMIKWIKTMKGRVTSNIAWKRILREVKKLEEKGYRCIPITKVIPDIITIKNKKVYAIEVEYGTPNYKKYTKKISKYFDDIIWLIKK